MGDIATIAICAAVIVGFICLAVIVARITDRNNPREMTLKGWGKELVLASPARPEVAVPAAMDGPPTTKSIAISSPGVMAENDPEPDSRLNTFWTAGNIKDLEAAWAVFRAGDLYSDGVEFWTTFYYARRMILGDGNGSGELLKLSNANPNWVWPLIELAKSAASQADWAQADRLYEQALARDHEVTPLIYARLIDVAMRRGGYEVAFKRMTDLLAQASAEHKGAVILAMVSAAEGDQFELSRQLLRELAVRYAPTQAARFDMAYAYADKSDTSVIGFRHYARMAGDVLAAPNVGNNLAVLYGQLAHQRLSFSEYESSIAQGNSLSVCNLAHELINAGFLERAEMLLAEHDQYTGHEENRAKVEAKLIAEKKLLDDDRDLVREETTPAFNVFQQFVNDVEQSWLAVGVPTSGRYGDGDGFSVEIDPVGASISLPIGASTYKGTLHLRGPVFEGSVSWSGATILAGAVTRRCILTALSDHRVRLLVLPAGLSTDCPIVLTGRLET